MKTNIILSLLFTLLMCCSCGGNDKNDELGDDVITRVQDGNGKVFLESGVLVDANLNFTQAQLEQALDNYEWETDYSFYYDNNIISSNKANTDFEISFHTNRTAECPLFTSNSRIRDVAVEGKQGSFVVAEMRKPVNGHRVASHSGDEPGKFRGASGHERAFQAGEAETVQHACGKAHHILRGCADFHA